MPELHRARVVANDLRVQSIGHIQLCSITKKILYCWIYNHIQSTVDSYQFLITPLALIDLLSSKYLPVWLELSHLISSWSQHFVVLLLSSSFIQLWAWDSNRLRQHSTCDQVHCFGVKDFTQLSLFFQLKKTQYGTCGLELWLYFLGYGSQFTMKQTLCTYLHLFNKLFGRLPETQSHFKMLHLLLNLMILSILIFWFILLCWLVH